MGPRNLLILFFSTVAVSLVILIIFFSLFFKNVDLSFNTKLPESAPDLGKIYGDDFKMNPDSKANGLLRFMVNVPPESREPLPASGDKKAAETETPDGDLPPISDDVVLEDSLPPMEDTVDAPVSTPAVEKPAKAERAPVTAPAVEKPAKAERAPVTAPAVAPTRTTEKRPEPTPRPAAERPAPQPVQPALPEPEPAGPPVPPQE